MNILFHIIFVQARLSDKNMNYIPSANLRISDIPSPRAKLEIIMSFALTFDPLVEVSEGQKMPTFNDGFEITLNNLSIYNFSELRYMLYFEQRRWNHLGRKPDSKTEDGIRQIVAQLIQKVENIKIV